MIITQVLILLLLIGFPIYAWYRPKIEIVQGVGHYHVYLWYNKWNAHNYEKRVYRYLFTI